MIYGTVGLILLFVITHGIAYYLGYIDRKIQDKKWENTSDPNHPDFDKDGSSK